MNILMNPNAPVFVPKITTNNQTSVITTPTTAKYPSEQQVITGAEDTWERKADQLDNATDLNINSEQEKEKNEKDNIIDEVGTSDPNFMKELKNEIKAIQEEEKNVDNREHVFLVFIGHVDAGKSTLSGNLLYLTGMVDKRTIEKYEKEAKDNNRQTWIYAYVMDTNEEERAKGKTVEVGRAQFDTTKKRYTILDTPGHKNYVPNMIGGAAQADIAILLISAKTGEFESGFDKNGQTREHAMLAKTLGIKYVIVAVNKMDEVKWSQERYDEIVNKLGTFLRKEVGYTNQAVTYIPLSGFSGLNVKDPVPKTVCEWYQGKPLLEVLDDMKAIERNEEGYIRFPVVDKYKDLGVLYAIGKIEAGIITKGQQILIMPIKLTAKVSAIYVSEDTEVKRAKAGESVRIAIQGVEEGDLLTGYVICDTQSPVKIVTEFQAQLAILELPTLNPLFTAGTEAVIHIHTCIKECQVLNLISEIDKKTKKPGKKKPTFVKNGAVVICSIQTTGPICLEPFDIFAPLGRFTLRDKGKTIAVGKVLKIEK